MDGNSKQNLKVLIERMMRSWPDILCHSGTKFYFQMRNHVCPLPNREFEIPISPLLALQKEEEKVSLRVALAISTLYALGWQYKKDTKQEE